MSRVRPGVVSVVVVNYQGADDTITCVRSLDQLDWPAERLEVIVVDNASGDGSAERIREAAPGVRLLALGENTGFAGGSNRGAAAATGEYLAFLNNDARPDPGWLREAVRAFEADPEVAAVASKVLDWDGERIDFVASALSYYGHGFKLHAGAPATSVPEREEDILFGTGSALLVRTEVFRTCGGFDDRFFMFFEDVDLGWRLWLLGWRVRHVPASVVFHKHHATMGRFDPWWEQYLLERNALLMIYKNYDDEHLAAVLPAALALTVRRGTALGGDDTHALDLRAGLRDAGNDRLPVSKQTLAGAYAVDGFVELLGPLHEERQRLQRLRQRPDHEILRLFRLPLHPNVDPASFREAFTTVTDAFDVASVFGERRRIVVATGDTLGPRMAGPAIRAWEIAKALSREHEVKLVSTVACTELAHPDFEVALVDGPALRDLEDWCDVFIFQGFLMHEHPFLRTSRKIVVVDIYDPFHLEQLEQARDLGEAGRRDVVASATRVLNEQLARGDFFLCASTKQRDFWLGQLAAVGRVNPIVYDEDESLDSLIQLAPFGIGDQPPTRSTARVKGVIPGIGTDDFVLLWGGGIYNWFDPLTLLRAVDRVKDRRPDLRLLFMGLKHPNPNVPEMRMAVATRALSDQLGLTGTHVFFNEGWVAYDERQDYLLESDLGVSVHLDHVETAFSFRTRILDYLWASLPVVATGGDAFGDLIEREGLGLTAPAEDVEALAEAIFRLMDDEELRTSCRKRIEEIVPSMRWSETLRPLVTFCRSPRRAPDLVDPQVGPAIAAMVPSTAVPTGPWEDLRLALYYLQEGGPARLAEMVSSRARRLLRQRGITKARLRRRR